MILRHVKIRYWDHVEFRRKECGDLQPQLRELTGWIISETEDYLTIVSDKAASNSLEEIANLKPSGFVILKSVIEEVEVIKNG